MRGLITERDFAAADSVFPGIAALYDDLTVKPGTFLELLQRYLVEPKRDPDHVDPIDRHPTA